MGRRKNTHAVLVSVDNGETGWQDIAVFGPFTSDEEAVEYRDKLLDSTAKAARKAAYGTSVGICVWPLRAAKVRAGTELIVGMIEEVR